MAHEWLTPSHRLKEILYLRNPIGSKTNPDVCPRFLGVVGHHEDAFPVERLDVNSTGELVASTSHDNRSGTRMSFGYLAWINSALAP